jgi:small neutral amino acid transporter SnatA (MarC family)
VQKLEHSFNSFFASEFLPFVVGPGGITNDPSLFKSLRSMHHYTLTVCTLATTALLTRIILTLIRCLVHYRYIFEF